MAKPEGAILANAFMLDRQSAASVRAPMVTSRAAMMPAADDERVS
jgi:hypothetical protein